MEVIKIKEWSPEMRIKSESTRKALGVLTVFLVIFFIYMLAIRPWFLGWGASDEEFMGTLPGDDLVPGSVVGSTRALTIHAHPSEVWPWLVQIGQDRGGFYSYELLEDLAGARMQNADRIVPEWQHLEVGDRVLMYPEEKPEFIGVKTYTIVGAIEQNRSLVLITPGNVQTSERDDIEGGGTWAFILVPVDKGTRLIVRGRSATQSSMLAGLFAVLIFEPVHYIMERKMMTGIKERAEGTPGSKAADSAQVGLWFAAFIAFAAGVVLVLVRQTWVRPLMAATGALLVLMLLCFLQPPVLQGVLLDAGVFVLLVWARLE